ncbi:MAG: hypothetical protein V2A73_22695, partial [Pseudomonadota bacterium]
LSGIFTFAVFFLGRAWPEIKLASIGAQIPLIRWMAKSALVVLPDLHLFAISGWETNGKYVSIHGTFVGWSYVGAAASHAFAWIVLLLLMAVLIFRRRDFS